MQVGGEWKGKNLPSRLASGMAQWARNALRAQYAKMKQKTTLIRTKAAIQGKSLPLVFCLFTVLWLPYLACFTHAFFVGRAFEVTFTSTKFCGHKLPPTEEAVPAQTTLFGPIVFQALFSTQGKEGRPPMIYAQICDPVQMWGFINSKIVAV